MVASLRRLALCALALACAGAALASSRARQQVDEERAVTARERYLMTNPWHPRVFVEYRDLLVARGEVDARAEELGARGRDGDLPAGVLSARLWAGAGELDRALAALAGLELGPEADPRAALLRAEWLAQAARAEDAARETERALRGLPPGEDRERALRLALALSLEGGSRDEVERSFARLVAERPNDLDLRLEVLDELLRWGWASLAQDGLAGAQSLAAGDPEAEVAVFLSEARVAAARGDAEGSTRAQRAALERLGRDHWRRAEVRAQAFEAARASGLLEIWRDQLVRGTERGGLLVAFEDLAGAELALGRPDEAWAVLERAAESYGADDGLRAARLALARRTGRTAESLALLQAEVEERGRLGASLDLADALVETGRLEAARVQWDRCAAESQEDGERLARVARRRARHGEDASVIALLERVVELQDASGAGLGATLDLARHHARHGRGEVARSVLDAAADARAEDARALEELGAAQLELGESERAEALWRAALARREEGTRLESGPEGDAARIARRLARLLQDEGRAEEARTTLRPFVEIELRAGRGSVSLGQLMTTFRGRDELARAAEREARRALSGEGGRCAWHLAAEGRARTRDAAGAVELWRAYLADVPDDQAALEALGRLEVERGELAAADATLVRLEDLRAGTGRELRAGLARAWAGAGERALALQTLAPLVRSAAPRDLAHLVRLQLELGAVEEALATRRRATALGAEDLETRLALAEALTRAGRLSPARDELRAAYRLAPEARRASIVETLARDVLDEGAERESWIGELLRRARAHPLDVDSWCLAADLRLRTGDSRGARDVLDEALGRGSGRAALLWRRARTQEALGRSGAALEDLRRARLLGWADDPATVTLELRALLAAGRSEEALTRALASTRPRVAAAILQEHGGHEAALRVLEAARRSSVDPELEAELAELYLALGRVEEAIGAIERRLQLGPIDLDLLERLGDLRFASGDVEGGLAVGRRLLAASPRPGATRSFFARNDRFEDWIRLTQVVVLEGRPDPEVLVEIRAELGSDPRGVKALLSVYAALGESARVRSAAPEGWSAPAWALSCAEQEGRLLRTWPGVLAGRCDALRERLRDPAPLSAREWIEVAFVAPVGDAVGVDRITRALQRDEASSEPAEPAAAAALARLASERPPLASEFARLAVRLAERLDGGDLTAGAVRERERHEIELALARDARGPREARLIAAGNAPRGALAWLDPDQLRRRAVVAAAAAGDEALERAIDAALEDAARGRLAGLLAQVEGYLARGRFSAAAPGLARLAERAPKGVDVPPDPWRRVVDAFIDARAVPEGYTALRRLDRSGEARGLVRDDEDRARCLAHFDARARRAIETLSLTLAQTVGEEAAESRDALREATILLLDFLPAGGTAGPAGPSARGAAMRALAWLPDDPVVRALLAREEELAGRFPDALEARRRALAALAEEVAPPRLAPAEAGRAVGVVRRASAWLILESEADFAGALRLGALRMELELGEPSTLATLRAWLAGGPAAGPTTPTLLLHLLAGYELGDGLVEHLAVVFDRYPEHGTLLRELLTAYCAQGRFADAHGALDGHLAAVPDPDAALARVARLRERVERLEAGGR